MDEDRLYGTARNLGGKVEEGATVGRIVQIHPLTMPFHRGDEKSVFKFGGSAIVVFGEPSKWRPAEDILQHTQDCVETLVRLGDTIGFGIMAVPR